VRSVVVDFETYYGDDFTLSKLTTEEYVRDPRFETILCGFKVGAAPAYWVDGPDVQDELDRLTLRECAVISHHAHFDGLILFHHYGVRPKLHLDTLSMARAHRGMKLVRNSLAHLCTWAGIPAKGDEVENMRGLRRADFSDAQLKRYGAYCINDCEREYELAQMLTPHFSKPELQLIDRIIRCYTEPVLQLNRPVLKRYYEQLEREKLSLLIQAGLQLPDVMSNEKFAEALRERGVEPPLKISKATGKHTYAFAKTDPGMTELAEHPDDVVQAMVAARLKNKSTINQTRARRLAGMSTRGAACVYYNYSGATQTHRLSGGDKMNWQNFQRGGTLRDAVEAPDECVVVVGDSSNIESRMLDWISGQNDQVEAYRAYDRGEGPDIYCVMAQKIFNRSITKKGDPEERQMGKVTKLMLGYGGGADMLRTAIRGQAKKIISDARSREIVHVYRGSHQSVTNFWKRCGNALDYIANGRVDVPVDSRGIVTTCKDGLRLPNGLVIHYTDLKKDRLSPVTGEPAWTYWNGKTREYIYGGKVCENIIQALARIVVLHQCLQVRRKLVMSSHDEGVWCVREHHAEKVKAEVENALRTPLDWCPDLPLNCEVGYHKQYGKAKK
jgi:hypothetical protein